MRRRIALLAPFALLLVGNAASAQASQSIEGDIELVDAGRGSVVIRSGGRSQTVGVAPTTMILLGGRPGLTITDLRPGQHVVAQFAVTQGGTRRPEVVRIEIRPAAPPPTKRRRPRR